MFLSPMLKTFYYAYMCVVMDFTRVGEVEFKRT